jgi:hypothetical protein
MRIVHDEMIGGYPVLGVRDFLRRYRLADFHIEAAEDALGLSPRTAIIFTNKLKGLGFIEELDKWDGRRVFRLTIKGQASANASGARPIHRKTAERILEQFLERVQLVNLTQEYVYRVEHVVLFGSMLSDVDRLGDVDVAVNLAPKVSQSSEFREWHAARIRAAQLKGRCFHTALERAYWPMNEVHLLLKAKSRSLSLHELAQIKHLPNLPYRVLLGVPEQLAALIPTGQAV